jgi:hypothetical protein
MIGVYFGNELGLFTLCTDSVSMARWLSANVCIRIVWFMQTLSRLLYLTRAELPENQAKKKEARVGLLARVKAW